MFAIGHLYDAEQRKNVGIVAWVEGADHHPEETWCEEYRLVVEQVEALPVFENVWQARDALARINMHGYRFGITDYTRP